MPHPTTKPAAAVKLQTFDPATFYPALSAREKMRLRDDSVFQSKTIAEPEIPKDFNPAVFYPALAARETKAKFHHHHHSRAESVTADSIYPSSSISQSHLPRSERSQLQPTDSELRNHQRMTRKRIWLVGSVTVILLAVLIFVFAWLGVHDWFRG